MTDEDKPNEQLIAELAQLSRRIRELEESDVKLRSAGFIPRGQADEEQTRLNQILLDAFPCVALLLRPSTREIVASNQAAVRCGAVPGTHCFSTWGARRDPCPWCLAPLAWASGEAQHLEVEASGVIWDAHWIPVAPDLYMHYAFDITERRRVEKAFQSSELMMKSILSASPVGIGLTRGRKIEWVNDAWLRMFGFESDRECVGQSARIVYPSREEYERVGALLYPKLATGEVTEAEADFRRQDGSIFRGLIRMKALDHSDPGDGVIGAISDISERKRAEEALRESEEKYRVVVENAQEAILVAQDGGIRFVNPKTIELLKYPEEELLSTPFTEFIHADDREMVIGRHFRRMQGEIFPSRYSFRILDKHGTIRWVEIDSALISWEGRPAALTFMTDITERLRMEEAIKESEEWYRTLVQESFDGLLVQQGFKIVFANSRLYEMLGYSPGELEGLDTRVLYHADYHKITHERGVARMRGEDTVSQYEVKLVRKDGTSLDGEISAKAVKVRGEPGVQVWVRDISSRKRSELAQKRLATAAEQAAEAIVITDIGGTIEYVNPAFEKITGYTREEILGDKLSLLKSEDYDPVFYQELSQTLFSGKSWRGRLVKRRKDGTQYHEDVTFSPVRDSSGTIVNFVGVKRDISQEVQLQKQLVQAQKMEAIGTLAGGIAHDFNNLLQVTMGYSEMLLSEKSEEDPDYADLQRIHHAACSGAELVRGLLTFSRKVEPRPVPMNLNNRIKNLGKLLGRTLPRMIEIRLELMEDLLRINADPAQIDQIIMNLAVNARDAMTEGGLLTIATSHITLDDEHCRIHPDARPGDHVLLSISDTGQGMDKETLKHIFEPFYTTKELGRGTGLGLAMVYGIVKQHGGHVTCHSEVGTGSTFNVYLPAISQDPDVPTCISGEMPASGTETVLLVDDDDFVRELGGKILKSSGYTVLTAANGEDALDLYVPLKEHIALVILDLIMPTMGGKECLKELLKIAPEAKVLIASGYAGDATTRECVGMGAKGLVGKPFQVGELLKEVRRILDQR